MGTFHTIALTVQVDGGPGVDSYKSPSNGKVVQLKSTSYSVEVSPDNGLTWQPNFTYLDAAGSGHHYTATVNFSSFSSDGPTLVRISMTSGPITSATIRPINKQIQCNLDSQGRLVILLDSTINLSSPSPIYDKAWVENFNGNIDSDPLLIFANPIRSAISKTDPNVTYFGPGVWYVADNMNLASTYTNTKQLGSLTTLVPAPTSETKVPRTIYLDAGAWVLGRIDLSNCTDVTVAGPGVLSGEARANFGRGYLSPAPNGQNCLIYGGNAGGVCHFFDFILVHAYAYNFMGNKADAVENVKIICPHEPQTDAFRMQPPRNGTLNIDYCFAFNGDDIFFPGIARNGNVTISHCLVSTTNNSIFAYSNGALNYSDDFKFVADDINVVIHYGNTGDSAIFHCWMSTNPKNMPTVNGTVMTDMVGNGLKNYSFNNIFLENGSNTKLEAPLFNAGNLGYFWTRGPGIGPFNYNHLGNSWNLSFKNICAYDPISAGQIYGFQTTRNSLGELVWPTNGNHNYSFSDLSINGSLITALSSDNSSLQVDSNDTNFVLNNTITVNHAPTATPQTLTHVQQNTATKLILNGVDSDGTIFDYEIAAPPTHGVLTHIGRSTVTYTPESNYTGLDSFTVYVRDNLGASSAPATINITVQ